MEGKTQHGLSKICRCFRFLQPNKDVSSSEMRPLPWGVPPPLWSRELFGQPPSAPEVDDDKSQERWLRILRANPIYCADEVVRDAPHFIRANRTFVLDAVQRNGVALQYVDNHLTGDKQIVLAAVQDIGYAFKFAADGLKGDRDFVLAVVKVWGRALQFAADAVRSDRQVALAAVRQDGFTRVRKYLSQKLLLDREFMLAVVQSYGGALEFAGQNCKADKDVVLAAVRQDGMSLRFASDNLREDKHIVLAAIRKNRSSFVYASGSINQEVECLAAAGVMSDDPVPCLRRERIVLSLRFRYGECGTRYAEQFSRAMLQDEFLGQFPIYNPSTTQRQSCDPCIDDIKHRCRGTTSSCRIPEGENLQYGQLGTSSCWRFAFRHGLDKCKATQGFMLQVQEKGSLSKGQRIEVLMAEQAGVKIFRTSTDSRSVFGSNLAQLSKEVRSWYEAGCCDTRLQEVHVGLAST